jgi:CHAT domain-containing protein
MASAGALVVPKDTAVLEYWIGGSSAAVLWITAESKGIKRWRFDSAAIGALRLVLSDPKNKDWVVPSQALGQMLFAEVAPLTDSRIRKLIVVPDGMLGQIPFEVLPFGDALLIDRFTVSYAPAGALAVTEPRQKPRRWFWRRSMEAFADPLRGGNGTDLVNGSNWASLPGARREVAAISSALGGRAAIHEGPDALKSTLRNDTRAPVLHFATHSFADAENPDLSYILLAPVQQSQQFDYLFLKEVADVPLTGVDLVTLSACETAVGKIVPGEGVESFSRAFLAAGVPAVVTSLWSVGDQSTADFMARFYSHLASGESAAGALRSTKLEFRHLHPANWAAFVLHGDGASSLPHVIGVAWFAIPLAVLCILAIAIRRPARKP